MISEKLRRVLQKYEIPISDHLAEGAGWGLVREHERASRKPKPSISICFSGFTQINFEIRRQNAAKLGFAVNHNVVNSTTYLCCGPLGVGPAKLAKAKAQNFQVISDQEFQLLVDTG